MSEEFGVPIDLAVAVCDCVIKTTDAVQHVEQWLPTDASLLVLAGDVGTGKTLAAANGLVAWWRWYLSFRGRHPDRPVLARGKDGFPTWATTFDLARAAPWDRVVERWKRCPFLVIDDVGEEESTGKFLALFGGILSARHAAGHRTVVTTNLTGATFAKRYGTRITDRLREGGLDEHGKARWWCRCTGDSLRGRVRPERVVVKEPKAPKYVSARRVDAELKKILAG